MTAPTQADKATMLRHARRAILSYLLDTPRKEPPAVTAPNGGLFVTLRLRERLRGCIGNTEPNDDVMWAVAEMAQSAAFKDPRFPALTRAELEDVSIEISILSPFTRLESLESLVAGRHGLMVERDEHRGLLLPQVASEQGWNGERFLQETCGKANLPPDAWCNENTKVWVFTAEVFAESG